VINDSEGAYAENLAERLKKTRHQALAVAVDVTNWQDTEKMFREIEEHFGGVDILVNNAGIRKDIPLHKQKEEDWDSAVAVQLKACFNCSRIAQEYMVQQNSGKIVNISSPVPAVLGDWGQTSYAAASSAIEGFTKALALELGPYNINVNCIAPDFIDTEMIRNTAKREGMYIDDFRKFAKARIPLKRMGKAEDVAGVALFLASDDSSFMTGQVLCVRGGP